jgi:nuclear pore complex protein Nup107
MDKVCDQHCLQEVVSIDTYSHSLIDNHLSEAGNDGLRAASERTTEKFAEQIDRLRTKHATGKEVAYQKSLKLLSSYKTISAAEAKDLRKKKSRTKWKKLGSNWDKRLRDLNDLDGSDSLMQVEETPEATSLEDELKQWDQETQTWELLSILLPLHHDVPVELRRRTKKQELASLQPIYSFSSEDLIWERFLTEDDVARERYATLKWLERNADTTGEDIQLIVDKIEEGAERGKGLWAASWLYTKEAIKAHKRLYAGGQAVDPSTLGSSRKLLTAGKSQPLITQLDPDAVTRQNRNLESQDRYFERAIWLACWELLRRGKTWTEVRKWCMDRMEGWRSISLRGGIAEWDKVLDGDRKLDADASIATDLLSNIGTVNGNKNKALWRMMCSETAKEGGIDDYERAVYGLLSGDYNSMAKICHSWDDFLFAHYTSLLGNHYDAYLKSKYPDRAGPIAAQKKGNLDLLHNDVKAANRRIIESLITSTATKDEASEPMKLIQAALISQQFPDLIFTTGRAIANRANAEGKSTVIPPFTGSTIVVSDVKPIEPDDFDSLRVLVHLLVVFREAGLELEGTDLEMAENVIVNYIVFLQMFGKLDLVPVYASLLSEHRKVSVLAQFCLGIADETVRIRIVKLMQQLEIDVQAVVARQLEVLLNEVYPPEQEEDQNSFPASNSSRKKGYSSPLIVNPDKKNSRFTSYGDGSDVIIPNFIGKTDHPEDETLIRSFEWFMLVDGFFEETFTAGAGLARRFLRKGRLSSARTLMRRMPTSRISLEKSSSSEGGKAGPVVDISQYIYENDERGGGASPFVPLAQLDWTCQGVLRS